MPATFSIITITCNNPDELHNTLKSTPRDLPAGSEIIVQNGGDELTLDTEVIPASLIESTQVFNEADSGIYDAMNRGLSKANCSHVIFMNSGDRFHNGFLFSMLPLDDMDGKCVWGRVLLTYRDLCFLKPTRMPRSGLSVLDMVSHQGVFVPMRLAKNTPFEIKNRSTSDSLWLNAVLSGNPCIFVPCIIAVFALGGRSNNPTLANCLSLVRDNRFRVVPLTKIVFKFFLGHIVSKRLYYILIFIFKYRRMPCGTEKQYI